MKKKLALGTALWGWGVTEPTAHDLLSKFYNPKQNLVITKGYLINSKVIKTELRWKN